LKNLVKKVVDQRGLANPRLAKEKHHLTLALLHPFQRTV
jgi:hypothetical protein